MANVKRSDVQSEHYQMLLKDFKKLAKRADQRLVNLEKLAAKDENYKNVLKYSYAKAMHDIAGRTGKRDKLRFNKGIPTTVVGLQARIRDVEDFLASQTSTKKGIDAVYKKRADTLNKMYNMNYTWQDLANFFESKTFEKLSEKYGYNTIFRTISKLQSFKPEDINTGNIRVDDVLVNQAIKDALAENGIFDIETKGKPGHSKQMRGQRKKNK